MVHYSKNIHKIFYIRWENRHDYLMNMAEQDKNRSVKVEAICTYFTYNLKDQIKSDWGNQQSSSLVFKGLFNEKIPIALKRYQKVGEEKETEVKIKRDLEFLSSAENRHPSLIRYFGNGTDDEFWYIAK